MKKTLAFLLIVCMLCACVPGLAATPITDYTLKEKWDLQLQLSGFKGTASFEAEGDSFLNLDDMTWQSVKMLSGLTCDVQSSVRDENRETVLNIMKDGRQAGFVQVLTDGQQYVVGSDLINANGVKYAFNNHFDVLGLLLSDAENPWPSVWPMVYALEKADDAWQDRAKELVQPYSTKLALWMQSYLEVTAEEDGEKALTRMYGEIPVEDVITQMKQLMVDLYRDENLLSLLKEVFSARESAAYLDKNMMNSFFSMLDMLEIEGTVVINRLYDALGQSLLDSISLPFAHHETVRNLTIAITPDGEGKAYTLQGAFKDGRTFLLTLTDPGDALLTGELQMTLPAEETESEEPAEKTLSAAFNLSLDEGEETYELAEDLCAQQTDMTLVIRPDEKDTTGMHEMSVSLRSLMTSHSSRRAATQVETDMTVTDQETGAYFTLHFDCGTVAPWVPNMIADLAHKPMQLDDMEDSVLYSLKDQWTQQLTTWVQQVFMPDILLQMMETEEDIKG